jgi:hypothetical protein
MFDHGLVVPGKFATTQPWRKGILQLCFASPFAMPKLHDDSVVGPEPLRDRAEESCKKKTGKTTATMRDSILDIVKEMNAIVQEGRITEM